jgi:hypothetical protein
VLATKADLEKYEKMFPGSKSVEVERLLEEYSDIRNARAKVHDFIVGSRDGWDMRWLVDYLEVGWGLNEGDDQYEQELQELLDEYGPDCRLTEAFDRDQYHDVPFPCFAGDL